MKYIIQDILARIEDFLNDHLGVVVIAGIVLAIVIRIILNSNMNR